MKTKTDVCLILEGTYPYVAGGVSSWVHGLVSSMSEFTFSLAVILPSDDGSCQRKFELPDNVIDIQHVFLHDMHLPEKRKKKLPSDAWGDIEKFHMCPAGQEKWQALQTAYHNFFNADTRGISQEAIPSEKEAWEILKSLYLRNASDESFIDYFWTFRFMHIPIFKILSAPLPSASIYHTVSTGYAGLLAAVAKMRYNRPVILTEHGIYTRERRFEISRADWIYEQEDRRVKVQRSQSRFKGLWNKMFATFSQICYENADAIITLFEGNQRYQIKDGAPLEKLKIIPNGIDYATFSTLKREEKTEPEQLVLGFMGRVVSIKDVKTFIRACKSVTDVVHNLKILIMGPTDEEPAYYDECQKLVDFLGLKRFIEFTGKVDVKEYYPKIDILTLTSISEAQPLVILEANSLGIPVVSTDVGACRELLYGRTDADIALGRSGLIAGITNSEEIANAILRIWRSPELMERMGEAGRKRVARFYNRIDLHNHYRKIYEQHIREPEPWPALDSN